MCNVWCVCGMCVVCVCGMCVVCVVCVWCVCNVYGVCVLCVWCPCVCALMLLLQQPGQPSVLLMGCLIEQSSRPNSYQVCVPCIHVQVHVFTYGVIHYTYTKK